MLRLISLSAVVLCLFVVSFANIARSADDQPPPPSQAILDAYQRGLQARQANQLWQARDAFREALDLARSERADTDGVTRELLRTLASVELSFGNLEEALALVREANDAIRRIHSDNHPELARGLTLIGEVRHKEGLLEEAHEAFDRAVSLLAADTVPRLRVSILFKRATARLDLGRSSEAEQDFRDALRLLEGEVGPDDPVLATLLAGLGRALRDQETWPEARSVQERRLALLEDALGEGVPGTEEALADLGMVAWRQQRYAAAVDFYMRAVSIQETVWGPDQPFLVPNLDMLGHAASSDTRFVLAADTALRALPLSIAGGLETPDQLKHRRANLAFFQQRAGRLPEAAALYEQLIVEETDPGARQGMRWRLAGTYLTLDDEDALRPHLDILKADLPSDPNLIKALADQAYWDARIGQVATAAVKLRTALEKAAAIDLPMVWDEASVLEELGQAYLRLDRIEDAERVLDRSVGLREEGAESWELARALEIRASVAMRSHRYDEARDLLTRSINLQEASVQSPLSSSDASVEALGALDAYVDLAVLHQIQGDSFKAEPLLRKALGYAEALYGRDHAWVEPFVTRLAGAYRSLGDFEQAVALYQRSLKLQEPMLSLGHPETLPLLLEVGGFLSDAGFSKEADPIVSRALQIAESAFGPKNRVTVETLLLAAQVKEDVGNLDAASSLIDRAVDTMRDHDGDPLRATALFEQGKFLSSTENGGQADFHRADALIAEALALREALYGPDHPENALMLDALARVGQRVNDSQRAVEYSRRSIALTVAGARTAASARDGADSRQLRVNRARFMDHIRYLTALGQTTDGGHFDESFAAAQQAGESSTASALRRMNARLAASSGDIADRLKTLQDSLASVADMDRKLVRLLGMPGSERDWRAEGDIRAAIAGKRRDIEVLRSEVATAFPEYAALVSPEPLLAGRVGAALRQDEAYVMYRLDDFGTYAWVITRNGMAFHTLPHTRSDVGRLVALIRESLEPTASGPGRFSIRAALRLHKAVVEPLIPSLGGVAHLTITADGPLQSLPFELLVTERPAQRVQSAEDYATVPWLGDRFAITLVPSAAALVSLRERTGRSEPNLPFIGIGDPVLNGEGAAGSRGGIPSPFTARGLADPDAIREFAPLPDTAWELRHMADQFGAGADALYLGVRATEAKIRTAPLDRARRLTFATHGLLAGEFQGFAEPALVLTPPEAATVNDDGLLSASEIATLSLSADLVVLSACNTAGSDGTPGAEGLSGLARAFFYAGARSLLVSHWPVESRSAARLTTGMVEALARDRSLTNAEALRLSAMKLRNDPDHPEFAHPAFWAPFSVVGGNPVSR